VNAFADEMEARLAANRHKGDRSGWAKESPRWLMQRLQQEIVELHSALRLACPECGHRRAETEADPYSSSEVIAECADIANFAMMIADVAGGMRPAPEVKE
jgi:NTP pyrophosphatase (non-canonical NTP hydrolase)